MTKAWQRKQLAQLSHFRNGKSIRPGGKGRYPAYGSNGVIGASDEYMYDDAIIIGRVGAYCGSVERCPRKFWASDNTIVVEALPEQADTDFLYYLLLSAQLNRHAGGAAQPLLTQSRLKPLEFRVPPLTVQRRIASILSAYDDLIENNTRRIAILEEMARRLYEEWFVHFRFPGHEGDKSDGELPPGWKRAPLSELVQERRETVHPKVVDGGTPYVGLEHIPRRSITLREWATASTVQSLKLRFDENDILFGKIRPYFHKVSLAPVSGLASSDAIVLRPHSEQHLPIALLCVSSNEFVEHATQTSNGTKMPRADWNVLKKYPIVIPPSQLLAQFNELAFPLLRNLKLLNRKSANLRTQRDLLLSKLVSGEINVAGVEERLREAAA